MIEMHHLVNVAAVAGMDLIYIYIKYEIMYARKEHPAQTLINFL